MKLNGAKVRSRRLSLGWTLAIVRRKAKLRSISTVSNAEKGREVYPGTAKRICDVLELDLSEVMQPVEDIDAA